MRCTAPAASNSLHRRSIRPGLHFEEHNIARDPDFARGTHQVNIEPHTEQCSVDIENRVPT